MREDDAFALLTTGVGSWDEPAWVGRKVHLPAGRLDDQLWSPDGSRIAFVAGSQRRCHVTGTKIALPFDDVTCVAWRPGTKELALLVGHEVLLVTPDAPGKPTVALEIPSEEYYDVVGMVWSPDGKLLALEAHSAELTD